jgi:hypothetical protein
MIRRIVQAITQELSAGIGFGKGNFEIAYHH